MTALERGVLILYDVADALYGPRKRRMSGEQKLAEFQRLLKRASAKRREFLLSSATVAGIEDFEGFLGDQKRSYTNENHTANDSRRLDKE
jgi:hypothetical protein